MDAKDDSREKQLDWQLVLGCVEFRRLIFSVSFVSVYTKYVEIVLFFGQ